MLSSIVAPRTGSLWSLLLLLDSHQATFTALTGNLGFCKVSELTLNVPCAAQQRSVFTQHAHTTMLLYSHSRNASYCTPPPLLLDSTYSPCFIPDCGALGCCQGTPDPSSSSLLQECGSWLWDQASLPALSQHVTSSETQRKVGLQLRVPCSAVRVINDIFTAETNKSSRNKEIVKGALPDCSSKREDKRTGSFFTGTQCSRGGTNSAWSGERWLEQGWVWGMGCMSVAGGEEMGSGRAEKEKHQQELVTNIPCPPWGGHVPVQKATSQSERPASWWNNGVTPSVWSVANVFISHFEVSDNSASLQMSPRNRLDEIEHL